MRRQYCCYWAPTGRFDSNGQAKYRPPVELKCRWEDVAEVFLDEKGANQVSNAKVYVDRDVKIQGILWLGRMSDLISQMDPTKNPGYYQIRKAGKLPTLRANDFLRETYL